MEMVRLLLDLGADKDCCDKNVALCCLVGDVYPLSPLSPQFRTILYYSILSGNESIVRMFLRVERCNEADKLWVRIITSWF